MQIKTTMKYHLTLLRMTIIKKSINNKCWRECGEKESVSQFSLVAQLCSTLCDPMEGSTPGFPVHHQLPELTQTLVYRVGDAIRPSHPLLSPSPPALNLSQHKVFSSELALCNRWPKYWSFSVSISPSNEYSGLISFRIDWFDLFAVQETLKSIP